MNKVGTWSRVGIRCAALIATYAFFRGVDQQQAFVDSAKSRADVVVHAALLSPAVQCQNFWQGDGSFYCPDDGIDGKKSPISFSVPLPTAEERASLEAACGGGMRISVSFRPRDCYAEGAPLRKIWANVEFILAEGQDGGISSVVPADTCFTSLPTALDGIAIRSDGGAPLWPPFGEARTSISCCESCAP